MCPRGDSAIVVEEWRPRATSSVLAAWSGGRIASLSWSPDGRQIVFVREAPSGPQISVIDVKTRARWPLGCGASAAFAADGRSVFVEVDSLGSVIPTVGQMPTEGGLFRTVARLPEPFRKPGTRWQLLDPMFVSALNDKALVTLA